MGLYLGGCGPVKIYSNGVRYCVQWYSELPELEGVLLLTSTGVPLKDVHDLYLTAESEDE